MSPIHGSVTCRRRTKRGVARVDKTVYAANMSLLDDILRVIERCMVDAAPELSFH